MNTRWATTCSEKIDVKLDEFSAAVIENWYAPGVVSFEAEMVNIEVSPPWMPADSASMEPVIPCDNPETLTKS